VLMLEGAPKAVESTDDPETEHTLTVLLEELPLKQAVSLAAKISGLNKNTLYQRALELKKEHTRG